MIPIVIGTRGSPLAQAQTKLIRQALRGAWSNRTFETHIVRTEGDRLSENPDPAAESPGKGLFTGELESALLAKKIHIAIHSLKDLPTENTEGLVIAAIPLRADARDVLVTRGPKTLAELPPGAQVATGSPRRAAQLKLARHDLQVVGVRGNIDTRLRKFRETAEWSALVLAAAGLDRLHPNLEGLVVTPLPVEVMLPAPGQGALALQCRADAADIIQILRVLHDPVTSTAVTAERAFLQALGGGCLEPIAAYAQPVENNFLHLQAVAWLYGEKTPRRAVSQRRIEEADRLAIDLAVEISR